MKRGISLLMPCAAALVLLASVGCDGLTAELACPDLTTEEIDTLRTGIEAGRTFGLSQNDSLAAVPALCTSAVNATACVACGATLVNEAFSN